jgi:nucleoside-diphosphate-sugar epimerase
MSEPEPKRVLLTGASGYVGGRLLVELQRRGMAVRCLARRPEFLLPKVTPATKVMAGDVLDRTSLGPAMRGIQTAYYLVHSMAASDFEETDRLAARNFAEAARDEGVQRIVASSGMFRCFFIGHNRPRLPYSMDAQRPSLFQTPGKSRIFPMGRGVRRQIKRAGGRASSLSSRPPCGQTKKTPDFSGLLPRVSL